MRGHQVLLLGMHHSQQPKGDNRQGDTRSGLNSHCQGYAPVAGPPSPTPTTLIPCQGQAQPHSEGKPLP